MTYGDPNKGRDLAKEVTSLEGQNMKKIPCSLLEVSFVVVNPVNYGSFAFKLRRVKWFFLSTSNMCFIFK